MGQSGLLAFLGYPSIQHRSGCNFMRPRTISRPAGGGQLAPGRTTDTSRRAVLRALASAVSVLALGGCARLAGPSVQFDVPDLSVNPSLLVATTRKPVEDGQPERWFGSERAAKMSVARAKLTPPPADSGRISLASMTAE